MTWMRALLILSVLLFAGNIRPAADPRSPCIETALIQPYLTEGVAVFSAFDGVREVRSSWVSSKNGDTILDMASLTKPLVAAEVRRRVHAGSLDLEEPIGALLPAARFVPETASITVRQLLQHRAGFDRSGGDPLFLPPPPSCHRAAEVVLGRAPEKQAGKQVMYSNAGYCILGEILLNNPEGADASVIQAIRSPLGAAGGWQGSLRELHAALSATLPLTELSAEPGLPDGSHYAYGWRRWPNGSSGPRWSHFGRLNGLVSVAVSDGRDKLLVAHFSGDPPDADAAGTAAAKALWRCMK